MTDSELIGKAQGIARCLSYNDDSHQAAAKHILLEMAHRLGKQTLRVHKKKDGLLLVSEFGQSRFLTLQERVLYQLFGVVPPIDGWRATP